MYPSALLTPSKEFIFPKTEPTVNTFSPLYIDGEMYNDMALNTPKEVQVNATFYDTNGKVVGFTRAFTDPEELRPEIEIC